MLRKLPLRWWIIALITLGTILNYLARSTLSVAAPTLKTEFAMSTEQYSWVVLGATEAAAIPAGTKTVSQWFPPKERPLATSLFQMGTSVGNMIAPPLVAFCILAWNWQAAFIVTGALSLVWAGLWWFGYRDPAVHPRLSQEERDAIVAMNQPDATKPATKGDVLRSRSFWAIAVPRFLAEPAWQTFNFFIPLYLVAVWKLDLKSIAMWGWMPFLAADFGSLAAGLLPPWLMKRGSSMLSSRKITMTLGALCMVGPACIGLATSPEMAIALFCIGGFAHQLLNGALITLCADVFDSRTVGTASGMAGTSAWVGGMLFTLLIGQSADVFGYNPLFVALAGLDLLAAVVLWSLLRARS